MPNNEPSSLNADAKRQAVASLRGYVYQIWRSVYAWIGLQENQALHLEGAEDFDLLSPGKAEINQVKDTIGSGNITLRSTDVISAIGNFWTTTKKNPTVEIQFRFLTTSNVGRENGNPFGPHVSGIDLWNQCARDGTRVDTLCNFLLRENKLPVEVLEFISTNDHQTVLKQLIAPIFWDTGNREAQFIEEAIKRKLIFHGDRYGVPPSESVRVVDALLKEALTVACNQKDRLLDRERFLVLFEEVTTRRYTPQQIHALTALTQALAPMSLGALPSSQDHVSIAQIQLSGDIPPLLPNAVKRPQLVSDLLNTLGRERILVLSGSTGMGKTTLANQIVTQQASWWWLNLTTQDAAQVVLRLRQVGHALDSTSGPVNIVLDDLDCTEECEQFLCGLIYTILERKGSLLITTQGRLSSRICLQLEIKPESFFQAPCFTQGEIERFLVECGCPTTTLAEKWGKVISAATGGHPHLVHARVRYLESTNWPGPKADDLFTAPIGEIEVKKEARQLLSRLYSLETKELAYRLSLLTCPFRHDQALAIGAIKPAIAHPGDALSKLVGPWIEQVTADRFAISPLLRGVASEIWSKDRIMELHRDIAKALLGAGNLYTFDGAEIFFHAWISQHERTIIRAVGGLIHAPKEVWNSLAQSISWFAAIGLRDSEKLFPQNARVRAFLRLIQYKIAAETNSDIGRAIAEAWDRDTKIVGEDTTPVHLAERYLFLSNVLMYFQLQQPMSYLIRLLVECIDLHPRAMQAVGRDSIRAPDRLAGSDGLFDPACLFTFVWIRCDSREKLSDLLGALENVPSDIRSRMLWNINATPSDAQLWAEKVWLSETTLSQPNWQECISVLQRMSDLANQWNCREISASAIRAIAVIYDEYLGDPSSALRMLDNASQHFGTQDTLEDERATIFFNEHRYEDALAIWERILASPPSRREEYDTTPIFSCRKAAICSANLGKWQDAANWFKKGFQGAKALSFAKLEVGFLADAAFCFWRAGESEQGIRHFINALQLYDRLPDPASDLRSFSVQKRVAHTLLWVERQVSGDPPDTGFVEPPIGFCSDPNTDEKWRTLGATPLDFVWLKVAEIEFALTDKAVVFDSVKDRLPSSKYPSVRFFFGHLKIARSLRETTLELLLRDLVAFEGACNTLKLLRASGSNTVQPLERNEDEARFRPSTEAIVELLLPGLLLLTLRGSCSRIPWEAWIQSSDDLGARDIVEGWTQKARRVLDLACSEAEGVMANSDDQDLRLLAAVRVATSNSASPGRVFYSHVLLTLGLANNKWKDFIASDMAFFVSKQWQHICECPAVLNSPRMTVPQIRSACLGSSKGWPKVAQILLAARLGVSTRLSNAIAAQLETLSRSDK